MTHPWLGPSLFTKLEINSSSKLPSQFEQRAEGQPRPLGMKIHYRSFVDPSDEIETGFQGCAGSAIDCNKK